MWVVCSDSEMLDRAVLLPPLWQVEHCLVPNRRALCHFVAGCFVWSIQVSQHQLQIQANSSVVFTSSNVQAERRIRGVLLSGRIPRHEAGRAA